MSWHPKEVQPCITCRKYMHINNPIHFLGSGYECHRCYAKRNKKEVPQICSNCGLGDKRECHEVKDNSYFTIRVKMVMSRDRKLICEICISQAELKLWWQNEQTKPRTPHPSYYTKHDPFATLCTCDFCTTIKPVLDAKRNDNRRRSRYTPTRR